MRKKVLITDDVHPNLRRGLEEAGFDCIYQPAITDAAVREVISEYTGLIINSKIRVDKAMLTAAENLVFVGRVGSGMEVVDKAFAAKKKIVVLSSPEGNRNAVAEQALGMLLSLANNLNRSNAEVKNFDWQREKNRGFELRGRTVGIIGFGHTGSAFAVKLLGLGMRVLVYDKYLPKGYLQNTKFISPLTHFRYPRIKDNASRSNKSLNKNNTEGGETEVSSRLGRQYDRLNYEMTEFKEVDDKTLLEEADIISFHLPLTDETNGLVNADFFKRCQKGVVILNTSRGNVVNTHDLIDALKSGQVGGACLDVFENEKTGTYTEGERAMYAELFSFDNVVVSPHIAGWTVESKERLANILLAKILKVLNA
jgi:D-3-phosphoglycerate dehydrogenase